MLRRLESAGNDTATWWLFLGTAFYERGHAELAEDLFRRALARNAAHPAATVGLAEALLTQKRYADVVGDLSELSIGTPAFLALQRSRALAAVAAGDAAAAESAAAVFGEGGGDPGRDHVPRGLRRGTRITRRQPPRRRSPWRRPPTPCACSTRSRGWRSTSCSSGSCRPSGHRSPTAAWRR